MFRQWILKYQDRIYSEEKFIETLLNHVPHIVKYNIFDDIIIYEKNNINRLWNIPQIEETEKKQLLKVRIGHGEFKKRLKELDCSCKICGLKEEALLIASHIKPWSQSSSKERLDVFNGFLLCPSHDALFDKGYISFDDDGKILISKLLNVESYKLLNINTETKINILKGHKRYLHWHRMNVFKS
ncbi:HNH endonuclease [Thermoactinomyces sp. CICC 10521]|uniref:HNH endonuclease n=1 Tax=Thermoactinomyces sp. CICC 10521 TaxID=2767426 RepID=UPI0018DC8F29|nr:HNH endonuclease [Thermoactinomyces sp. CICC 10521]MBH8609427.1 HNH endonuclease [Thermoactinomyces sp. CICC 10521]